MNFNLTEEAKKRILIVAHRGTAGANIPCNTLAACEIALAQGADMLEIDVEMSADGKLYVFHPGMEPKHLGTDKRIPQMTSDEIAHLRYVNYDRATTQFGINTFDELLESFRGRCFINVDKFWGHPKEIYSAIERHGMTEQILAKSMPSEDMLSVLREVAPGLPYMAIARDSYTEHERLLNSGLNYVGVEVWFESDTAEVASYEFAEKIHRDGKLLWGNSIVFNHKVRLAAQHTDDNALLGNPELGWGWYVDHGFDLIQTDWPLMLKNYLTETKKLYKSI